MTALLGLLLFAPQVDLQALLQEGLAFLEKAEHHAAIELWERGLAEARKQGDELFVGSFLGNIGVAYASMRDYSHAVAALEESVRLGEAADDRQGLKTRLNALASIHLLREEPDKALPLFRRALALAIDLEDKRLETDIVGNLALAYLATGNYVQAISHMRRAVETSEGADKTRYLLRLAAVYSECGDVAGSLAAAREAQGAAEAGSREAEIAGQLVTSKAGIAAGGHESILGARVEGLERMLARLRKYGQDALAAEVERQLITLRGR